jgi:ABC-type transporter Mla subunit MlaD
VSETDQQRHDPLGDVINLFAAPIAGGIRSIEQFRHGIDELFRTIDNLNNTLETINEAAARVNRFMSDVEEPVRAMLPQLTRTVQAADELMEVVSGPARRITPNLVQIVDTLGSPAFTTLPTQLGEFMRVMGDVSRRLGPLAQFAESAGGVFGFRIPGSSRSPQPTHASTPLPLASAPELSAATSTSRSATPKKTTARKTTAKKSGAKRTAAKQSTAKKSTAKKR